jgi:hypothetical protein
VRSLPAVLKKGFRWIRERKVYGMFGCVETRLRDPCTSSDRVLESRICEFALVAGRWRVG